MFEMTQVFHYLVTLGIPAAVLLAFILANAMYLQLMERKVLAHMQSRLGPMRAGWHGLLQPIADAVKLLAKEDFIPAGADRFIFLYAPALVAGTVIRLAGFILFLLGKAAKPVEDEESEAVAV